MSRLKPAQLWQSLLILLIYTPVVLAVGSASFRSDGLATRLLGVPISVWAVGMVMVALVILAWRFANSAFDADQPVQP